ncbi:MAG: Vitamin B12 import ATP-binding protein BtuD [Chlamydiia bacterium]|nr:Vitamin B12 import ATP-binding protein BtuD [Chlamydiia bacterium]
MRGPLVTELVVKDVSFQYDQNIVLDKVNFNLTSPGLHALIGPNGAGKSTILKLILSLLKPTRGEILIDGKDSAHFRDQCGYVPQTNRFDKDFPITAHEVIRMGVNKRLPKEQVAALEKDLLSMLSLEKILHKQFGKLSGGQMQRILIARALMCHPKLLILDEPTSNIDPETTRLIHNTLFRLKEEILILMVSHDLESIVADVDSVFCVQNHVVKYQPDKVCSHFQMGVYHSDSHDQTEHPPILKKEHPSTAKPENQEEEKSD